MVTTSGYFWSTWLTSCMIWFANGDNTAQWLTTTDMLSWFPPDSCTNNTYQYKYLWTKDTSVYYLSPTTTQLWSWDHSYQLIGSYNYTTDNGASFSGIYCNGSDEEPHWGIGCSTGPGGDKQKVLPWQEDRTNNADHGLCEICQDIPGIFGEGIACDNCTIYTLVDDCNPTLFNTTSGVWHDQASDFDEWSPNTAESYFHGPFNLISSGRDTDLSRRFWIEMPQNSNETFTIHAKFYVYLFCNIASFEELNNTNVLTVIFESSESVRLPEGDKNPGRWIPARNIYFTSESFDEMVPGGSGSGGGEDELNPIPNYNTSYCNCTVTTNDCENKNWYVGRFVIRKDFKIEDFEVEHYNDSYFWVDVIFLFRSSTPNSTWAAMSNLTMSIRNANAETNMPTSIPTTGPSFDPTYYPTYDPTIHPTLQATSQQPTFYPTSQPVPDPTHDPSHDPSYHPTYDPTSQPTPKPTPQPTAEPTGEPTGEPTDHPGVISNTTDEESGVIRWNLTDFIDDEYINTLTGYNIIVNCSGVLTWVYDSATGDVVLEEEECPSGLILNVTMIYLILNGTLFDSNAYYQINVIIVDDERNDTVVETQVTLTVKLAFKLLFNSMFLNFGLWAQVLRFMILFSCFFCLQSGVD